MKRLAILFSIALLCAACGAPKSESEQTDSSAVGAAALSSEQTTSDPAKDLAAGSDACKISQFADSLVFSYANYTIATREDSDNPGERIWIFSNNAWHRLACDEPYFKGLIDHYIILDYGTSTVRALELRDLANDSLVFSQTYYDELRVEQAQIHFWTQVEPDSNNRPNCEVDSSTGLTPGYVEDQYFDTKTLTASQSGIIKCYLFE